jgi:phosphoglycolate phosphatase
MKIENILFDLDGTLTDPKSGITESIQYALRKLGKPIPAVDDLIWCIGPPLQDSLKKLLAADTHMTETALSLYRKRYQEIGKCGNQVYPGIPETLTGLIQQGFKLFVATSKPHVYANDIIVHFDLLGFFKRVYGSELDGARADKKELIAFLLKNEEILAENTLMVGDRCYDITGAKKNKVLTLGVTYGYGTIEEMTGAGADYIVDSPQEIIKLARSLCDHEVGVQMSSRSR